MPVFAASAAIVPTATAPRITTLESSAFLTLLFMLDGLSPERAMGGRKAKQIASPFS